MTRLHVPRLVRLAQSARRVSGVVTRLLKQRRGVALVNGLALVLLRVWPSLGTAGLLRVLDWAGGALRTNSIALSDSTPTPLAGKNRRLPFRHPQSEWLLERLRGLPVRRKAQLLALAASQAARHVERQLTNDRARSDEHRLTLLRWLIVATTDACNLRCLGCYAKPVWAHRHVPFSRLQYIAAEAERMGVEAIFVTGWGEPFLDRRDKENLFRLVCEHPGMMFAVFTNGTLITQDDLRTIQRLGNLVLLLSLDGLEETNDTRRGRGIFQRVAQTARELKQRGVPFGMSVTVTSANYREVTSAEFVDIVRDWGALWTLYLRFTLYPAHSEAAGLSLAPKQVAEYLELLAIAQERQPLPLIDADESEKRLGGCCAQAGTLAFVDAVTGRVSGCLKLPLAPPSHNLFENTSPGRLAELLHSEHLRAFWNEFPDAWQCSVGCKLKQVWTGKP